MAIKGNKPFDVFARSEMHERLLHFSHSLDNKTKTPLRGFLFLKVF